jgi:hypothetical protein
MPSFRLNRRAVLRGAGSVAIALPWLEIMRPKRAQAASSPAKSFVAVFTPGGTVLENWRPSGTEEMFTLGPILKPLDPVKRDIIALSGVDMKSARGEQNQSGLVAWLTGTAQAGIGNTGFATGPSIDQVLKGRLSSGPLQSLELAVRWGTGKSNGLQSPINIANYADTPTFDPIAPRIDPVKIWQDLFGTERPESGERAWDRSILDGVRRRYLKLSQQLGAEDRKRLEQHLQVIRELEQRVASIACTPPELVDTSDYNPEAGRLVDQGGATPDRVTDAAIPKVGKLMMDMLVMALSCNLTSVATLMWSDTEAKHTFPWLGLNEHLHYYMNDGGYRPNELTTIFNWYSSQHAYLIDSLARVAGRDGSLLDETVLFFGSQVQHPATHIKQDMPFLLAGRGGGLRPGRWLRYERASHNDLLVALCNLCGDPRHVFGDEEYCSGPLGGLT